MIKQQARQNRKEIIAERRYLHSNPELSFKEVNTSAYIQQQLTEADIAWEQKAGTGIVAEIHGGLGSTPVIALRSDMDALPIAENTDVAYRSLNAGVMHACGHDAHMAMLLGAARILQRTRKEFSGTIKLIFQPAEEKLPGGAKEMINEGVLLNPVPEVVFGQHVRPDLPAGKVGICKGLSMASMDEIFVRITGKGGHAAQPNKVIDPVNIAAQLITAMQQVVSRFASPLTPTVLSFGKLIANGAINIIPDEVLMEGTFRTFDEQWRYEAHNRMKSMAEKLVSSMGGQCEFTVNRGYPSLHNDEQLSDIWTQYAVEYVGEENVIDTGRWMASEDFAYYSLDRPSVFYYLGVGNEKKNISAPLHSPDFNIDEDALEVGVGLMVYIALRELANNKMIM
ncbi:MAG: amidohydrolase [Terrimonas sp.]|nr:amidohydrolase [Terrimonas sp.]OJY98328.1 MAG: N-acyl-L-amino acid amidohydrolase [Sphingobacteriales bacterium 40-81]